MFHAIGTCFSENRWNSGYTENQTFEKTWKKQGKSENVKNVEENFSETKFSTETKNVRKQLGMIFT